MGAAGVLHEEAGEGEGRPKGGRAWKGLGTGWRTGALSDLWVDSGYVEPWPPDRSRRGRKPWDRGGSLGGAGAHTALPPGGSGHGLDLHTHSSSTRQE